MEGEGDGSRQRGRQTDRHRETEILFPPDPGEVAEILPLDIELPALFTALLRSKEIMYMYMYMVSLTANHPLKRQPYKTLHALPTRPIRPTQAP